MQRRHLECRGQPCCSNIQLSQFTRAIAEPRKIRKAQKADSLFVPLFCLVVSLLGSRLQSVIAYDSKSVARILFRQLLPSHPLE